MTTDAVLNRDFLRTYDFSIAENGDIETEDFFDSSILVSLFTDKRANAQEVPTTEYRRGWIGDESNSDGFQGGSKIWLFEQERLTRDTLNGIVSAAIEGLQWLINENLAINVNAQADLIQGIATLTITIARPNGKVERRFFDLWNNTAKRG